MPSRLQRQFHVTGTQYISTDKVQSQTLNTGGTAETFSPWANKPRAFFTIFIYQGQKVVRVCFNLSHQTRRPTLGRISAAPFCPTLYSPIHSSEIYLFSGAFAGVVVTLSAWTPKPHPKTNKFPSVPIHIPKGGLPKYETNIRQQTLSKSLKRRRRRIPLRLPRSLYHRHQ